MKLHWWGLAGMPAVVAVVLAGCAPAAAPSPPAASAPTGQPAPAAPPVAAAPAAATSAPAAATSVPAAAATSAPAAAQAAPVTLTLYNAQHEDLVTAMVTGFTQSSGIKVDIRSGKDFELANQIVQEGGSSPADVFVTENSPAMQVVQDKGLFAPVDKTTLAQVPPQFAPSTADWVGVAARATVLVYNPSMISAEQLPKSIMNLSESDWKDRVGVAATGADFQAIVSAVLAIEGTDATADWLKGLKSNARIYSGNGAVMKAVNTGEIPAGVIYHYYWYKDRAESGANSSNTELYFFPDQDPGGFVSVSGLGALKSSKHPREAQMLLQYMTGAAGQKVLADSTALEYTVNSSVPANPKLKPLSELSPPNVDTAKLNGPQVIQLMQDAGLL
jgi:iron(III) transport system substrate-binding protein